MAYWRLFDSVGTEFYIDTESLVGVGSSESFVYFNGGRKEVNRETWNRLRAYMERDSLPLPDFRTEAQIEESERGQADSMWVTPMTWAGVNRQVGSETLTAPGTSRPRYEFMGGDMISGSSVDTSYSRPPTGSRMQEFYQMFNTPTPTAIPDSIDYSVPHTPNRGISLADLEKLEQEQVRLATLTGATATGQLLSEQIEQESHPYQGDIE